MRPIVLHVDHLVLVATAGWWWRGVVRRSLIVGRVFQAKDNASEVLSEKSWRVGFAS